LLCRRHHRAVHEEGYHVDRRPDVPPPCHVPADPVQRLRARAESEGLVLHATTATPGWFGEPLDVRWALDVLHPLARQPGQRAMYLPGDVDAMEARCVE
jgi:hypothetical protein